MIPTTIYRDIPRPFPQDGGSNLQNFLKAHQVDLNNRDGDLEYIKRSHDITQASGRDLELIGQRFGILGQRRGRGDGIYRHYLAGLTAAFSGRGTRSDVKYAFASGLYSQNKDNIIITEDVENHQYSLTVTEWEKHSTSLIEDYSEFAEPSGVELSFPVEYIYENSSVTVKGSDAGTSPHIEYPSTQVKVKGGETTGTIVNEDGLGSDILGGGDTLGPSKNNNS